MWRIYRRLLGEKKWAWSVCVCVCWLGFLLGNKNAEAAIQLLYVVYPEFADLQAVDKRPMSYRDSPKMHETALV